MSEISDWIIRLENRMNDHIEIERKEWDRIHQEIAIVKTKMDNFEEDLKINQKILFQVKEELAEFRGVKKATGILMAMIGIGSSAATAIISYFTLRAS